MEYFQNGEISNFPQNKEKLYFPKISPESENFLGAARLALGPVRPPLLQSRVMYLVYKGNPVTLYLAYRKKISKKAIKTDN